MLAESEATGYQFLRRVVDEWDRGVNRFSRAGRRRVLGGGDEWPLGGRSAPGIDPYLDDLRVGRVRNVYVLAKYRKWGLPVASSLRPSHEPVAISTGSDCGPRSGPTTFLYESLGFRPCLGIPNCTHIREQYCPVGRFDFLT